MTSVIRFFMPDLNLYRFLLDQIWKTGKLTNGPLVLRLRVTLKNSFSVQNLLPIVNGMLELQFAIKTLDLNGEIVQPSIVIDHCQRQLQPACPDGAGLGDVVIFYSNPYKMGFVYLLTPMGVGTVARMTVRLLRHMLASLMRLRRRSNAWSRKFKIGQWTARPTPTICCERLG